LLERTRNIYHRGVVIWYSDYSNLKGQELVEAIRSNIKKYLARPKDEKEIGLALLNIDNAVLDRDAVEAFKRSGEQIRDFQKVVAVVGAKGMKGVIIDWVSFFTKVKIKTFHDEQTALDWLVEQKNQRII